MDSHLFSALLHLLSSVGVRENSSIWLKVTPSNASAKLQRKAPLTIFQWYIIYLKLKLPGTTQSGSEAIHTYCGYEVIVIIHMEQRLAPGSQKLQPLSPKKLGLSSCFTLHFHFIHISGSMCVHSKTKDKVSSKDCIC